MNPWNNQVDFNFPLEETPRMVKEQLGAQADAAKVTEPPSGHYKTCYICGLDPQKYGEDSFYRKEYKSEWTENTISGKKRRLVHYVITYCNWCAHRWLQQ